MLARCGGQNQSIREVSRSDAKNIKGATGSLCVVARLFAESRCSPTITFVTNLNEPLHWLSSMAWTWVAPCPRKVDKCLQMSRHVYICRAKMEFLARLFESFNADSDGYLEDRLRAFANWILQPSSHSSVSTVLSVFIVTVDAAITSIPRKWLPFWLFWENSQFRKVVDQGRR